MVFPHFQNRLEINESKRRSAVTPKEAAHAVFEAMNRRELDGLAPLLSPDAVFDFPGAGRIEGPKAIERFLKILFRRFPRLVFTPGRVIAEGDAVAVEWTNEGEDRKGAPYQNAGVTVIVLEDGRIASLSDTFKDTASFSR